MRRTCSKHLTPFRRGSHPSPSSYEALRTSGTAGLPLAHRGCQTGGSFGPIHAISLLVRIPDHARAGGGESEIRGGLPLHIYVDADACPVKQEVYRVARRYGLGVTLVAGSWMNTSNAPDVALEVVVQGFDAADDWIVAHAVRNDIVITGDIPLAARCLEKGVYALGPAGRPFTDSNIGEALATRNLLSEMRGAGQTVGGPPPFDARDRSRFLQALDRAIHSLRRAATRRDGWPAT